MKVLVTGSSGHLSEALVRTLRDAGRDVVGADLIHSDFTDEVGPIVNRDHVRWRWRGFKTWPSATLRRSSGIFGRHKTRRRRPSSRHSGSSTTSPEGFTQLALAAHFGHEETAALPNAGASVNAVSKNEPGVTALHAALNGGKTSTAAAVGARRRRQHPARWRTSAPRRMDSLALHRGLRPHWTYRTAAREGVRFERD